LPHAGGPHCSICAKPPTFQRHRQGSGTNSFCDSPNFGRKRSETEKSVDIFATRFCDSQVIEMIGAAKPLQKPSFTRFLTKGFTVHTLSFQEQTGIGKMRKSTSILIACGIVFSVVSVKSAHSMQIPDGNYLLIDSPFSYIENYEVIPHFIHISIKENRIEFTTVKPYDVICSDGIDCQKIVTPLSLTLSNSFFGWGSRTNASKIEINNNVIVDDTTIDKEFIIEPWLKFLDGATLTVNGDFLEFNNDEQHAVFVVGDVTVAEIAWSFYSAIGEPAAEMGLCVLRQAALAHSNHDEDTVELLRIVHKRESSGLNSLNAMDQSILSEWFNKQVQLRERAENAEEIIDSICRDLTLFDQ